MFFAVLIFALIAALPAEAGPKSSAPLKIVAFGDSLTSGHRLPQKDAYPAVIQQKLNAAGYKPITTEIAAVKDFWYAEEYHQQYLQKNPAGYCGIGGTGVSCA